MDFGIPDSASVIMTLFIIVMFVGILSFGGNDHA